MEHSVEEERRKQGRKTLEDIGLLLSLEPDMLQQVLQAMTKVNQDGSLS